MKRVWLITGASRGLGAALAARVREAGDTVVATARKPVHGQLLELDVTKEAQIHATVATVIARFGAIDVLVNSAGYGVLGAVEEASAEQVERVFATNVFGLLHVTRAVLPHMRERRAGHIVHLSAATATTGFGIFNATKRAVDAIGEAMSLELAPLGIHTTVLEPGYFRTGFLSTVVEAAAIDDYVLTAGASRTFAKGAPGQQPGDPSRFADVVVALVNAGSPPQRMPLGADAVKRIECRGRLDLDEWRGLALTTGFVDSSDALL